MIRSRLIVLEGVCWPGFAKAMRNKRVPNLARLSAAGATGLLRGIPHQGRIDVAGSIATGAWPEASGVWFAEEAWAGGIRPLTRASWQRPPLWATLGREGISTASVVWPGSARSIGLGDAWISADSGVHIDDRLPLVLGQPADAWALPPDCCPPPWRDIIADCRIHPTAITAAHILPLVPDLRSVNQSRTDVLNRLAVTMAEAATAQGAAARVFTDARPDTAAVWLRWLYDIRAVATAALPPYNQLVTGAWSFLDALVGGLAALCTDERLIIVGTGFDDAPGLVLASGPGIAGGSVLPPARVIDVAPTMLACHGLADRKLAGQAMALPGLASARGTVNSDAWAAAAPKVAAPAAAAALLKPLLAEGFRPPPPPSALWHAARALRLGALLLPRDPVSAEAAADQALAEVPDHLDALSLKAWCRLLAGDEAGVDAIGKTLLTLAPDRPWGALARGVAAAMTGNAEAAKPWLSAAAKGDAETRLRVANTWAGLGRPAAALALLGPLADEMPGRVDVCLAQAEAARLLGDSIAAEAALRAALRINPFDTQAWARLQALLSYYGRALEAAQAATMLLQLQPEEVTVNGVI